MNEELIEELVIVYPDNGEHHRDECVYADYVEAYILKEYSYQCEETGSWYHEHDVHDHMTYCEFDGVWVEHEYAWECEDTKEWFFGTDYKGELYDGGFIHTEGADDFEYVERGQAEGYWMRREETRWCYDIDGSVHYDDATYCEADGEYYYDENEMPSAEDDEHICSYHGSPEPYMILNAEDSYMRIGFEIEKTYLRGFNGYDASDEGDHVGAHELFKGYETDSSCGIEAITNILPLDSPRSEGRNEVFEYFDEADCIINSPVSKSCGGHICISVKGWDSYDILDKMRGNMAILYSMYRWRLKRVHCRNNKKLLKSDNTKYSPVNVKDFGVEIRIPSAVKSVRQLKLRYDLIYKIMYHSLKTRQSYDKLLEKIDYILMRMYKDRLKVDQVKNLSYDFRKYLLSDEYPNTIREYLEITEDED